MHGVDGKIVQDAVRNPSQSARKFVQSPASVNLPRDLPSTQKRVPTIQKPTQRHAQCPEVSPQRYTSPCLFPWPEIPAPPCANTACTADVPKQQTKRQQASRRTCTLGERARITAACIPRSSCSDSRRHCGRWADHVSWREHHRPSQNPSDAQEQVRYMKMKERNMLQTYVVLEVILIVLIVLNLVKVLVLVEVLELECLAGEVVNCAGDNLFRILTSEESIRIYSAGGRTLSLRSPPSW